MGHRAHRGAHSGVRRGGAVAVLLMALAAPSAASGLDRAACDAVADGFEAVINGYAEANLGVFAAAEALARLRAQVEARGGAAPADLAEAEAAVALIAEMLAEMTQGGERMAAAIAPACPAAPPPRN